MIRTLLIISTSLAFICACGSEEEKTPDQPEKEHSHEGDVIHEPIEQIEREGHEAVENAERKVQEYEDSVGRAQ